MARRGRGRPKAGESAPVVRKNPFSPAFVNALLRFFWICYRHGMEDACRSDDLGECEEALVRLKDVRRFGTVAIELDWNEWQFKSLQWTREDMCRARIMDLVMTLRLPTHRLGFLMQLAKMYYIRGVRDWMECCEWLTLGMIEEMPRYPYLLKRKHSYRKSQIRERFEFLQNEVFNLIELQKMWFSEAEEYAVRPSTLRMFTERAWSAMQKPKWFDDFDVETDAWDEIDPVEDVTEGRITTTDYYTEKGKGRKNHGDNGRNYEKRADRGVSRENEDGCDVAADGVVLQSGTPKRRRGRPPKNV